MIIISDSVSPTIITLRLVTAMLSTACFQLGAMFLFISTTLFVNTSSSHMTLFCCLSWLKFLWVQNPSQLKHFEAAKSNWQCTFTLQLYKCILFCNILSFAWYIILTRNFPLENIVFFTYIEFIYSIFH